MSGNTTIKDDEALARALQEEYSKEFRRSQELRASQRSLQPSSLIVRGETVPAAADPTLDVHTTETAPRSRSLASSRRPPRPEDRPFAPTFSTLQPTETDEEFARRLERQFREEEERQARLSVRPSAPVASPSPWTSFTSSVFSSQRSSRENNSFYIEEEPALDSFTSNHETDTARRMENAIHQEERTRRSSSNLQPSSFNSQPRSDRSGLSSLTSVQEAADEEFARRLQAQLEFEAVAAVAPRQTSQVKRTTTPLTSSVSSDEVSAISMDMDMSAMTDEELALRVEQELKDEEMARRISALEQQRVSSSGSPQVRSSSPRCSFRRVCSYLIPVSIILAIGAGVAYYFSRGEIPDFFPSPEDFRAEDPFNAKNPDQVDKWRTRGNGLELEVVSALEDGWYTFFEIAVAEWDDGSPDTLTLTKSYQAYDYECDPINFKLKVCNGDYGATRWRGINKILLADGFIFASSARMNEYYFTRNGNEQKQYTMCHELGHGFGLPHSDESFTNKDLGNCMDYTNNPAVNMQPDESNFLFLADLYGEVPTSASEAVSPQDEKKNQDKGGKRLLRDDSTEIPQWVMEKWRSLESNLENHAHNAERRAGWRLLHENEHGEAHEIDIGGGYRIQVHKLLASEDS